MEFRYEEACRALAQLSQLGISIYAPIPHTHPMTRYIPLQSHDFWMRFDLPLLLSCDEVWVLMLDGWEQSKGVMAELEVARKHRIPISFVSPGSDIMVPEVRVRPDGPARFATALVPC
jgi:hypothetical protein